MKNGYNPCAMMIGAVGSSIGAFGRRCWESSRWTKFFAAYGTLTTTALVAREVRRWSLVEEEEEEHPAPPPADLSDLSLSDHLGPVRDELAEVRRQLAQIAADVARLGQQHVIGAADHEGTASEEGSALTLSGSRRHRRKKQAPSKDQTADETESVSKRRKSKKKRASGGAAASSPARVLSAKELTARLFCPEAVAKDWEEVEGFKRDFLQNTGRLVDAVVELVYPEAQHGEMKVLYRRHLRVIEEYSVDSIRLAYLRSLLGVNRDASFDILYDHLLPAVKNLFGEEGGTGLVLSASKLQEHLLANWQGQSHDDNLSGNGLKVLKFVSRIATKDKVHQGFRFYVSGATERKTGRSRSVVGRAWSKAKDAILREVPTLRKGLIAEYAGLVGASKERVARNPSLSMAARLRDKPLNHKGTHIVEYFRKWHCNGRSTADPFRQKLLAEFEIQSPLDLDEEGFYCLLSYVYFQSPGYESTMELQGLLVDLAFAHQKSPAFAVMWKSRGDLIGHGERLLKATTAEERAAVYPEFGKILQKALDVVPGSSPLRALVEVIGETVGDVGCQFHTWPQVVARMTEGISARNGPVVGGSSQR